MNYEASDLEKAVAAFQATSDFTREVSRELDETTSDVDHAEQWLDLVC
jgi:hypothetical protein